MPEVELHKWVDGAGQLQASDISIGLSRQTVGEDPDAPPTGMVINLTAEILPGLEITIYAIMELDQVEGFRDHVDIVIKALREGKVPDPL